MREILFRGKQIDNGEWAYGYYVETMSISRIIFEDVRAYYCEETVIPETVGQYTGLKDKNGTKIFEGDVVCIFDYYGNEEGVSVVEYFGNNEFGEWYPAFDVKLKHNTECNNISWYGCTGEIEVIGNIHDNPKLLEETK